MRAWSGFLWWPVALVGVAGLLAAAWLIHERNQPDSAGEPPPAVIAKQGTIKFNQDGIETHGIADEKAKEVTWRPRVAVYGRVVPNPQATAEVRSPFAGTLRADPEAPWPVAGRPVVRGQVLGRVDVRVGPQERLDLVAKRDDARLRLKGTEEILKIQQERVQRLKPSPTSQIVSQNELDEALFKAAEAKTQLTTAAAAVELWDKALDAIDRRPEGAALGWSEALTAPSSGEVVELAARPGVAVEAGGLVARVVDFRRPLVRLDLPPEVLTDGPPPDVDLVAVRPDAPPLGGSKLPDDLAGAGPFVSATLVGPAPQTDSASQLTGYWYAVAPPRWRTRPGPPWRPGLFVKAAVTGGESREETAVSVPASAVLYHQGRALVYVTMSPGRFERRQVRVLDVQGDRCLLAAGTVDPSERVVYANAQALLSAEFRADLDD